MSGLHEEVDMRDTRDPEIQEAAEFVYDKMGGSPDLTLVLGSGLGAFAEDVSDPIIVPTTEVPGYPASTVAGHAGRLVGGTIDGVRVLVIQGRVHFYEGYPMEKVVYPVRIAAALGSKGLVVTNAAGGIGDHLEPGDLMAITDHVNMMGTNPLIGQSFGFDRFPDMSRAYDPDMRKVLHKVAIEQDIKLKDGVLGGWTGPTYETAAEIQFLRQIGVSAGCMSTIPEVITAARLKLPTCGISCITNKATGISPTPLTHEEVQETAARVESIFRKLLKAAVPRMAEVAGELMSKM